VPDLLVVGVSIIDDDSLNAFKEAVWLLTGLIRVFLRTNGRTDERPLALEDGATVLDVATAIHNELAAECRGARIWGPSARFDGQQVGPGHIVRDTDTVEILA
jgi:ribosome-interacting GTPase 1